VARDPRPASPVFNPAIFSGNSVLCTISPACVHPRLRWCRCPILPPSRLQSLYRKRIHRSSPSLSAPNNSETLTLIVDTVVIINVNLPPDMVITPRPPPHTTSITTALRHHLCLSLLASSPPRRPHHRVRPLVEIQILHFLLLFFLYFL
jgi:hypothetical protein